MHLHALCTIFSSTTSALVEPLKDLIGFPFGTKAGRHEGFVFDVLFIDPHHIISCDCLRLLNIGRDVAGLPFK